jgi:isoprenylcysteine carboxyl methyltransferase (ICMT) family protein YpbQ
VLARPTILLVCYYYRVDLCHNKVSATVQYSKNHVRILVVIHVRILVVILYDTSNRKQSINSLLLIGLFERIVSETRYS